MIYRKIKFSIYINQICIEIAFFKSNKIHTILCEYFWNLNGGPSGDFTLHPQGVLDPPSPGSLIFQNAIRSILNSLFGRTDSILAPIKLE